MTRSSHLFLTAAFALTLGAAPSVALAQAVVQPLPGTTDADRLGDTMRELATNPRNVDALIRAGELSMGLGDLSGAAALFARAEKIDPRNGRMKAGMASILVRSERPGEALRYFAQAESYGLPSRYFAADRGLAYDLIGQQDRAQRDYREALRTAPDDETVRRYALSLGISGKQDLALKQLEPLIAKTDRGAWRARAFILAMTSDVPGAEHIATTMMPAGMAQGLLPFFRRLPALAPADRAFAVHFGEVSATPERIADARMVPPLPILGPDATAPVMMAAVQQPAAAPTSNTRKRDRKARSASTAMAAAARTPTPSPTPMPTSPVDVAAVQPVRASVSTGPAITVTTASVAAIPVPAPTVVQAAPVAVAQVVQPLPQTVPANAARPTQRSVDTTVAARTAPMSGPTSAPIRSMAPNGNGQLPAGIATQMAALPATGSSAPIVSRAGSTTVATSAAMPAAIATPAAVQQAAPAPGFSTAPLTPAPVEVAAATSPPRRAVTASEDSILARIIAGLSIPAAELDVAPVVRAAPVVAGSAPGAASVDDGARVVAEAKAKADRDAAARKIALEKLAADKAIAAEKAVVDKKIAAKKALADKKALAEKTAAAEKKAVADKEAAEAKRIERANPSRIWVQVAGGATEGDLPKAYRAVKAKAPDVFGTRSAWTTPLRATNRVLTGPFKTDAEARTFVNQLAKAGVSAFSFTSDSGQVVTKLSAK